jgi:pimeloyl-ACP methyl ester carboxylesterase
MSDTAASADGTPIAYEVHGTGTPALVFVHGWSCDRTYWADQVDHFAARHQVVMIDLAGHGESGGGRTAWTMPAFGEDVVAVVDRLGLQHVVLVGHSMGGDVIVEAAVRLADRVAGIVWVDVYTSLDEAITPEGVQALLQPFREDFVTTTRAFVRGMFVPSSDPGLVDRVVADMSAAPPEVALSALEHSFSNEGHVVAGLRELSAPVVAINLDDEPTDIEGLRRHGVTTVIMAGVGHFAMMEDPAAFNRILDDFVDAFSA